MVLNTCCFTWSDIIVALKMENTRAIFGLLEVIWLFVVYFWVLGKVINYKRLLMVKAAKNKNNNKKIQKMTRRGRQRDKVLYSHYKNPEPANSSSVCDISKVPVASHFFFSSTLPLCLCSSLKLCWALWIRTSSSSCCARGSKSQCTQPTCQQVNNLGCFRLFQATTDIL